MVLIVDGGPTTVLLLLASNLVRSREKWGSRDLSTSLDSAKLVWNVHQQQRQQQQQQHWGSFFFMWWRKWTRYCAFFCKEKKYDDKLHGFPMLRTSLYVISVDVIALKLKIVLHLKALSSQLIVRISVHVIRFKLSEFINWKFIFRYSNW